MSKLDRGEGSCSALVVLQSSASDCSSAPMLCSCSISKNRCCMADNFFSYQDNSISSDFPTAPSVARCNAAEKRLIKKKSVCYLRCTSTSATSNHSRREHANFKHLFIAYIAYNALALIQTRYLRDPLSSLSPSNLFDRSPHAVF